MSDLVLGKQRAVCESKSRGEGVSLPPSISWNTEEEIPELLLSSRSLGPLGAQVCSESWDGTLASPLANLRHSPNLFELWSPEV